MKALCLLLVTLSTLAGQEKTGIQNASVTLPYSEVRELINLAQKSEAKPEKPAPPVSSLISRVQYTLEPQLDGGAKGKAVIELQSLVESWQAIDLLDSNLTVISVEPADTILVRKGDWLSLALNEVGSRTVTIEFFARGHQGELFRFKAVPAISSILELQTEESSSIKLAGAQRQGADSNRYHLPPVGGEVVASRRDVAKEAVPSEPTQWEAMTESLIMTQPDVLKVVTRLQLLTRDAEPGNRAILQLPKLAVVQQVKSATMERYALQAASDPGFQLIEILWESGGLGNRQVELSYEIPRPLNKGSWKIELPSLVPPLVTSGTLAIIPPDELNLAAPQNKVLDLRLPGWMERESDGSAPLMIDLPDEQKLTLEVTPKQRLLAARLTITEATYETQIVKGGDLLTGCELKIEHEKGASWSFSLPQDATLLACRLDGSAVSPIILSDGSLELPLKAPEGRSIVKLSYTAKTEAMNPVEGSASLTLLRTDAFCHSQSWAISLPAEFETTAVEGNIPFHPSPPNDQKLHLLKQLSQGETPAAQIYYRKKTLDQ